MIGQTISRYRIVEKLGDVMGPAPYSCWVARMSRLPSEDGAEAAAIPADFANH
jgi:hypothetical protein